MSPPPRAEIPRLADLDLLIETERLRLRPFTADDVEVIWPYVSDPAFPRQMSWAAHQEKSETYAWVEAGTKSLADGSAIRWAIELEGAAAGCIALEGIRWQMRAWRTDRAEIGYWMAPPLWGKGYMTEATRAVMKFGFESMGLHKIYIGCLASNPGSRRVIEKCGFRFIGNLEEDVWRDDGWESHLRYELTVTAWSDVTTTVPIQRH